MLFLFLARFSWLIELLKKFQFTILIFMASETFCVCDCLDFLEDFFSDTYCDLFDFCLTNSLDKIYAGLQHS